ncbi:MAG: hypothetical protein D6713_05540 [Deltaproteobacteria bacterium]|nr:MAG: hypothetical protein D6713_05540 [Deltaproteobacteria bacterium]
MGRPRRIVQTTFPYHITTRTNNRTFRFHKKKIVRIFMRVLNRAIKKYNVTLYHVVLMSNHYHLILKINEHNLPRFVQFLNSRVAMEYNKISKRSGHLWGDRYRSTIISSDEHYLTAVRYIYENPVRAGIVKNPDQFPNSSFHFHAFGHVSPVYICQDSLVFSLPGKPEHLNYHEAFRHLFRLTSSSVDRVKEGLRRRFFGPPEFVKTMEKLYPV